MWGDVRRGRRPGFGNNAHRSREGDGWFTFGPLCGPNVHGSALAGERFTLLLSGGDASSPNLVAGSRGQAPVVGRRHEHARDPAIALDRPSPLAVVGDSVGGANKRPQQPAPRPTRSESVHQHPLDPSRAAPRRP